MKISGESFNIEGNFDKQSVRKFQIETNSTAINVWMDGLYSNKIRSIIRELLCNARDSHQQYGTQSIPIDVHLPDPIIEPYFYIRDYGVGLDRDEINDVYTVFFKSTKRDTNDLIGGFGLGSKTPFAYTKSFTIESYKNGIKTVYIAFKDQSGYPCVSQLSEDATDQPNGLKVQFQVEDKDCNSFISEYQSFYMSSVGFNLRTLNHSEFERGDYQTLVECGDYQIATGSRLPVVGCYACIGGVLYPIGQRYHLDNEMSKCSREDFVGIFRQADCPEEWEVFKKNVIKFAVYHLQTLMFPVVIRFPIGSLELTASREEISYTPRTINQFFIGIGKLYTEIANQQPLTINSFCELEQNSRLIKLLTSVSDDRVVFKFSKIWNFYGWSDHSFKCDLESLYDHLRKFDIGGVKIATFSSVQSRLILHRNYKGSLTFSDRLKVHFVITKQRCSIIKYNYTGAGLYVFITLNNYAGHRHALYQYLSDEFQVEDRVFVHYIDDFNIPAKDDVPVEQFVVKVFTKNFNTPSMYQYLGGVKKQAPIFYFSSKSQGQAIQNAIKCLEKFEIERKFNLDFTNHPTGGFPALSKQTVNRLTEQGYNMVPIESLVPFLFPLYNGHVDQLAGRIGRYVRNTVVVNELLYSRDLHHAGMFIRARFSTGLYGRLYDDVRALSERIRSFLLRRKLRKIVRDMTWEQLIDNMLTFGDELFDLNTSLKKQILKQFNPQALSNKVEHLKV